MHCTVTRFLASPCDSSLWNLHFAFVFSRPEKSIAWFSLFYFMTKVIKVFSSVHDCTLPTTQSVEGAQIVFHLIDPSCSLRTSPSCSCRMQDSMNSIHLKGDDFKSLKLMLIINRAPTYCNYGFNTLSKRTTGPDNVAWAQIRYSPGTSQCLSETCFTRVVFTTGHDHYDQRIKMWSGLWQNNGCLMKLKLFLHRQTRSSQMQLVLSCESYPSSFMMFYAIKSLISCSIAIFLIERNEFFPNLHLLSVLKRFSALSHLLDESFS